MFCQKTLQQIKKQEKELRIILNLWENRRCFHQIQNQKELYYRVTILLTVLYQIKETILEIKRVHFLADDVQHNTTMLEYPNRKLIKDHKLCPIVSVMRLFRRASQLFFRSTKNLEKFQSSLHKEIQSSLWNLRKALKTR